MEAWNWFLLFMVVIGVLWAILYEIDHRGRNGR